MPNLEITATGNVTGAVTALEKVDKVIVKVVEDSKKIPPAMQAVSQSMDRAAAGSRVAETAINKAGTSLGTNLKVGANQATGAMINLGRVVQDAPFGFLGIANNLNPLLESFQRLRAETGSAKGALAALGSSFIGAGGLGFAISIASAALSFFSLNGLRKTTEEAEKHTKVVEKVKDTYQIFSEEVTKLAEATAKEAAQISVLFGALSDNNIKLDERKVIIKQLNDLSPAYLGNLNSEKASYEQVSKAINNYIDDLGKSAFIKSFLPEFEGIFKKLIETQVELRKLNLAQNGIFGLSEQDYALERKRLETQIRVLKQDISTAKKFLEREAGGANNLSEILFGKNPPKPKEIKVKPEKIIVEKPDRIEFSFLNEPELSRATGSALTPTLNLKPKINIQFDPAQAKKVLDGIQSLINAEKIQGILDKSINTAVSGLADSFAGILSGAKNGFSGLFDGLASTLAGGLKEIGKYLVETYLLIGTIQKIKFSNPAVGVAVGFALQVLGSLIQSKINTTKGFATGVRDFQGGGIVTVGERGPERIFLPQHSTVQPNNEMMAYGGGNVVLQPSIFYEGTGFRIMLNRVDERMSRNG